MSKLFESLRIGFVSSVIVICGAGADAAWAQQADAPPAGGSTSLGPVTVDAPVTRRRITAAPRRAARPQRVATTPRRPPVRNPSAPAVENPRGAITGYVAGRSMSGTKTNTPLLETPQAISVIGSEQIRDQKPANLSEILRYAPGVVGGTFGVDPRNDWFLIRGFKSDDNSTFLDGLQLFYTGYASWKLPPFNLERVDILRGPSAVLYGGSSQAGLVNAISKMPPAEPLRYMETGINQYGNRYLSFDFGGPVPLKTESGQLFYRLVGQLQSGGTQTDFVKDDNYFIAPSLTWKPDADTTFTLLASAQKSQSNTLNFLPYVGTVTSSPFGRIPTNFFLGDPTTDHFKREQDMIGYQFERNLTDNITFRQNARFAHIDVDYAGPYGGGYVSTTPLPNGLYVPNSPLIGRSNFMARDIANQANLDNQFEVRFRTGEISHTALFGADFKYYSIDDIQGFGGTANGGTGAFPVNFLNPVYTPTPAFDGFVYQNSVITQKQVGLYAQDQIKWDRWTLVLSGRNDFVGTNNDSRIGPSQSRSDSKFSGRAGLIYTSDIGLAPYVSYATSYNPIIGVSALTGQLFLPETGQQTEVGIKFSPAGMNGYISAALFDLKRQNALSANSFIPIFATQTGEVTSRGLELEAVANLTPEFKMMASFTTYHLFNSKDPDPSLIGKTPPNTPQQIASAWGDYTIKSGPLTGLGFGAGVRYRGASYADLANQFLVPSAVVGDASIHYEWDGWRLALNVDNITDKIYVSSCSSVYACYYADRRRATASLAYKW